MHRRAIEHATRRWINAFVIKERLCPFAAASSIIIQTDAFGNDMLSQRMDDDDWHLDPLRNHSHAEVALAAIERADNEVSKLLLEHVESEATSNLFIVWPVGLQRLDTFRSFVALLAQRAGVHFAGVTGEGADTPAVAFPFHPQADDYKFKSPFPMAHFIPQAELSRTRRQLKARKAAGKSCLLTRNLNLMREASETQRDGWDALLAECRRDAVHAHEKSQTRKAEGPFL